MSHDTGHHTKVEYEHELVEHDQWFRHSPDEPHHQQSHGATKPIPIIVTLVGTILLVFVIAGYTLNFFDRAVADREIVNREMITDTTLAKEWHETSANWNAELSSYSWLPNADKKEIVRLPFDAAMNKVIAEYKAKPK